MRDKVLLNLDSASLRHLRMVFHNLFSFIQLGDGQSTEKKKILPASGMLQSCSCLRGRNTFCYFIQTPHFCILLSVKLKCSFHLKKPKKLISP